MSRRGLYLTLFACLALAQLAAPLSMIVRRERVLLTGRAYKFKTAPIDPSDAFRGRYVALSFELAEAPAEHPGSFEPGQKVCALLREDEAGFGQVASVSPGKPADGVFLWVKAYPGNSSQHVRVELPFDRYYLEEELAPTAERAYREHSRRGEQDAYAVVRVKDGMGVIEELYVGGQPIREFIRGAKTAAP